MSAALITGVQRAMSASTRARNCAGVVGIGDISCVASFSRMPGLVIALKSGTQMVHIPYPSSPQAVTALIRGDVQLACLPAIAITPQLCSGQI